LHFHAGFAPNSRRQLIQVKNLFDFNGNNTDPTVL